MSKTCDYIEKNKADDEETIKLYIGWRLSFLSQDMYYLNRNIEEERNVDHSKYKLRSIKDALTNLKEELEELRRV